MDEPIISMNLSLENFIISKLINRNPSREEECEGEEKREKEREGRGDDLSLSLRSRAYVSPSL